MKSMKEMLEEMGFNSVAPHSTQKAFLKNLVEAATASLPRVPSNDMQSNATKVEAPKSQANVKRSKQEKPKVQEQLAFDFSKTNRVS